MWGLCMRPITRSVSACARLCSSGWSGRTSKNNDSLAVAYLMATRALPAVEGQLVSLTSHLNDGDTMDQSIYCTTLRCARASPSPLGAIGKDDQASRRRYRRHLTFKKTERGKKLI